jgi:S-adenosylmethionine-diacylgycerolhomoserine-N-methlytransferase
MNRPATRLLRDLRTIARLARPSAAAARDADRLSGFYSGQADDYDRFRERLLHGRRLLLSRLAWPARGGTWVDVGGGTASSLAALGSDVARLERIFVVDLARPLLEVAKQRVIAAGWRHVQIVEADARAVPLAAASVDVVTFSYSLTMMPDWFAAIDEALRLLKPGGRIGVADFYVSRKHPAGGSPRHPWLTRTGWPAWFAYDNVFLHPDLLPYLRHRLDARSVFEGRGRVPYLPGCRAPYFVFVGVKPSSSARQQPDGTDG